MHERVAPRVRGPDLHQPQHPLADLDLELAAERLLGEHELDALEVERAEAAQKELSDLAQRRRLLDHRGHCSRGELCHLRSRALRCDDTSAADELVAVAVVAVCVRVDERVDARRARHRAPHRAEHLLGEA